MNSLIPVVLFSLICSATCLAQSAPCNTKNYCVGAEKREITAPPGFPTGGHGPAGNIARGSWSRNWARAFVIKDTAGTVVVLVSCDTFAVPLNLTSHVWDNVEGKLKRAGLTLKPEGLLIAATHSHQGAGNYMDTSAYNDFGSVKGGFSGALFNFLVRQISDAIIKAAENMVPAELHLHQAEIKTGYDEPFLVNRSPATFAQNYDAGMVLSELGDFAPDSDKACPEKHMPGEPEDGWNLDKCPRLRAVDRRMLVLQAKEISSGQPISDLVFFAVHPTVLIHNAPLFNSDFTGYAMDALERKAHNKLVAAFFNGAEGDVTARRFNRDVLEVVERGEQFLAGVETTVRSKPEILEPRILVSARLINTRSSADRTCVAGDIIGRLAKSPLVGAAQPGGGELDRTIFFDFGWRTGVRNFQADHDQGGKKRAIDVPFFKPLTDLISNLLFPSRLSVTYLKLGRFSLGALPLEVSTTAGYRIRKNMESSGEVFQLLGLTNGYASYLATASEYAAQDYMGASTLWGPNEAEFFRCQLVRLRNGGPTPEFKLPDTLVGLRDPFNAAIIGQKRDLPDEELEEIIRDKGHMPVRQLPFSEWSERVPNRDKYTAASKRRIWITTTTGEIVDDTDVGFIKILTQAPIGDCQVWNGIWLGPLFKERPAVEYVFHVQTAKGDELTSCPFRVDLNSSTKPSPQFLKGQPSCNEKR